MAQLAAALSTVAAAGIVAGSLLAIGSAPSSTAGAVLASAASDPILAIHAGSLTTYLPSASSAVQGVRPQIGQRGVNLDGSLRRGAGFGFDVAGNPFGGGFGGSDMMVRASKADVYNSPGWARMQRQAAARPVSQPREARHVVIDAGAISAYGEGDRVFHQKFGAGTVTYVEGDKLDVHFDHAGMKKVVARFVTRGEGDDAVPF